MSKTLKYINEVLRAVNHDLSLELAKANNELETSQNMIAEANNLKFAFGKIINDFRLPQPCETDYGYDKVVIELIKCLRSALGAQEKSGKEGQ